MPEQHLGSFQRPGRSAALARFRPFVFLDGGTAHRRVRVFGNPPPARAGLFAGVWTFCRCAASTCQPSAQRTQLNALFAMCLKHFHGRMFSRNAGRSQFHCQFLLTRLPFLFRTPRELPYKGLDLKLRGTLDSLVHSFPLAGQLGLAMVAICMAAPLFLGSQTGPKPSGECSFVRSCAVVRD